MIPQNTYQQFLGYCRKGDMSGVEGVLRMYPRFDVDRDDPIMKDGMNGLMRACQARKLEVVAFLVEKANAKVDAIHAATGNTPLGFAAEKNHFTVVEYLLGVGANVHHVNNDGKTPLRIAEDKGLNGPETVRVIRRFLESPNNSSCSNISRALTPPPSPLTVFTSSETNVSALDRQREPREPSTSVFSSAGSAQLNHVEAFLKAARAGDLSEIIAGLEIRRLDVNVRCLNGFTALIRASQSNKLEVVQYLVDVARAELDIPHAATGNTALLFAAEKTHNSVVAYLLKKGANAQHINVSGESIQQLVARKGLFGVETLRIIQNSQGGAKSAQSASPLVAPSVSSSKSSSAAVPSATLSAAPSMSSLVTTASPSELAVQGSLSERYTDLLKLQQSEKETTPLFVDESFLQVVDNDNAEQLRVVLNSDKRRVLLRGVGETTSDSALLRAVQRGNTDAALLLIDEGADVNVRNKDGKMAFLTALEKSNTAVAHKLLESESIDVLGELRDAMKIILDKDLVDLEALLRKRALESMSALLFRDPSLTVATPARHASSLFSLMDQCQDNLMHHNDMRQFVTKTIIPAVKRKDFVVLMDTLAGAAEDQNTVQLIMGMRNENNECVLDVLYSMAELTLVQKCLHACRSPLSSIDTTTKKHFLRLSQEAGHAETAELWQNEIGIGSKKQRS